MRRGAPVWRALALALSMLVSEKAAAGIITDCSDPMIFEGSDVNLVIVPYTINAPNLRLRPNSLELWENEGARALSTLIQFDTLHALHFPADMAVVQLFSASDECTIDVARSRVRDKLSDGKGVVLLWGSLVEHDGEIFVQSYVEFFRKNEISSAQFSIPFLSKELELEGDLPQYGLGLPPHIIAKTDMERIIETARSARAVASAPGEQADNYIPENPEEPFGFYVTGTTESGWMQIRSLKDMGDIEGWIPARPEWSLRTVMPELEFVEASMGFLATRIIEEERAEEHWAGDWRERYAQARERSTTALERFLASYGDEALASYGDEAGVDVATATALTLAMKVMLVLDEPALATEGMADAAEDLTTATKLVPYQAETHNLRAIALAGLVDEDTAAAEQAAGEWRVAMSLAPGDRIPALNLARFYRALQDAGRLWTVGIEQSEFEARLELLEK